MVEFLPSKQAVASSNLVSRLFCIHRPLAGRSEAASHEASSDCVSKGTIMLWTLTRVTTACSVFGGAPASCRATPCQRHLPPPAFPSKTSCHLYGCQKAFPHETSCHSRRHILPRLWVSQVFSHVTTCFLPGKHPAICWRHHLPPRVCLSPLPLEQLLSS